MGWNNKEIIQKLYENIKWIPFSIHWDGYKSSLIYLFERKPAIFVSRIENKTCKIEIYQDSKLSKIFKGTTPEKVWEKTGIIQKYNGNDLFGLANEKTQKILHNLKIPNCLVHKWNEIDLIEKIYSYHLKRRTLASIDYIDFLSTWQKSGTIIELYTKLKKYYPKNYKFNERELSTWHSFLYALGCTNITLWSKEESEFQLWTRASDYTYPIAEKTILENLYKLGFCIDTPIHMPNTSQTFWSCFIEALAQNKKTQDGKRRILSIIAEDFTYSQLQDNLKIGPQNNFACKYTSDPIAEKTILENLYKLGFCIDTPIHMPNTSQTFWSCFIEALAQNKKTQDGKRRILSIIAEDFTYSQLQDNLKIEARKHARINGRGLPPLSKPIISRIKFTPEKLDQFKKFFTSKDIVNMSSYKSDHKSGLPILYLQDHKQMLWEKFHEFYPTGMKRTAFMTRLQGSRYVYQDNLGGLCSECNECGYEVFGEITALIKSNINDEIIRKELLANSQILRRYIRRNFSKQFQILPTGEAQHNSCISHCLRYAFGSCNFSHPDTCFNCEMIFSFFNKMKEYLSSELYEQLDGYQKKLIKWMGHHARKTYLNKQVQVSLDELDNDGAVLIVDYKMKIVPQTARETKKDWYGKRGWALHTVLVYTKDLNLNQLNVHAFDHWSDDTRQDAWFTASSLHAALEILDKKPKWITILFDNGPHYHCTELMIIIGHWYEWYNIKPRKWIFLEAGEAKTSIDSHHAQISQAMKRYIKLGSNIESGDDIEEAIKYIAGTHVANLIPNRSDEKNTLGTIHGIRALQEWSWPTEGENEGFILGRPLPGIGEWKKWSPAQIKKISKTKTFEKSDPICSTYTQPDKLWTMPIVSLSDTIENNKEKKNRDNKENFKNEETFLFLGARVPMDIDENSRINEQVKNLLEIMFHIGTANPRQKLSAEQMYEELLERVNNGELTEEELPKVTTISNWISGFSRKWKTAMAVRSLEETENLNLPNRYLWILMKIRVKNLLEIMFHIGTANPRQKLSAEQMYEELLERVNNGELTEEELPKVTTISNWISGFSRKWKTAMAVRSLEETENLNLPNSS
ncbi:hypothetical protein Glove_321g25 [Diversispora epigaea]|uniref:Uncharacterized protein n=1 Tax=Diversispora epigaea TaxID=1348612 RepID=A0A397HU37_9GLOM|nr:hypothetical protein Glove_321g25 [Diversispora epigaea]